MMRENVQCDVCGKWGPFQYIGGNFLCRECREVKVIAHDRGEHKEAGG